jgi:predicted transposase YdaD
MCYEGALSVRVTGSSRALALMINDPHDRMFKAVFSQAALAAELLCDVLPSPLAGHVDFRTLQREPGDFVDHRLGARFSDLLFSARLAGAEMRLCFLIEHRSGPEPHMPFRLQRYATDAGTDFLENHPRTRWVPVVIGVVLHHGKRPWRGPRYLREMYDLPRDLQAQTQGYVPDFAFLLDDLAVQSEASLRQRALSAAAMLALWLFMHAHTGRGLIARLPAVSDLLVRVVEAQGIELASTFSRYIIEVGRTSIDEVMEAVESELDSRLKEPFMNAAEQLRREGWKKGREEGIRKGREEGIRKGREEGIREGREEGIRRGRRSTLLKLLALRFGPLPERVKRRVRRAGDDKLDEWTERVLAVRSLDEVFAAAPPKRTARNGRS